VPTDWVEPIQTLGYTTIEKLKEVEKPGKLGNDLFRYKKKNRLDLAGLMTYTRNTVSIEL